MCMSAVGGMGVMDLQGCCGWQGTSGCRVVCVAAGRAAELTCHGGTSVDRGDGDEDALAITKAAACIWTTDLSPD